MIEPTEAQGTTEKQRGPRPGMQRFFFGPEGLRPGWGCLIFLFLLYVLASGVSFVAKAATHGAHAPTGEMPPGSMLLGEALSVAMVLAVTAVMARIEHRPLLSYGLSPVRLLPRFSGGLVTGIGAISLLVGFLFFRHLLVIHGPVLSAESGLAYGSAWALCFFLVAVFEEMLLRGYLFFTLARGIGPFWSAVLLSISFGAIHGNNKGETPVGLISAGVVGLVFCLAIWYTRTLWWAIGFHAAWDWGQSFFYGTGDSGLLVRGHLFNEYPRGPKLLSGGATGPEGSVFIFPLLAAIGALIYLWWHRRRAEGTAVIEPVE